MWDCFFLILFPLYNFSTCFLFIFVIRVLNALKEFISVFTIVHQFSLSVCLSLSLSLTHSHTHTHAQTHTHTYTRANTHTHTHIYIYIYIYIYINFLLNGPGDQGSISGRLVPQSQKMVAGAAMLNTQHHVIRIKGKVEQFRECSSTLPSYCKGIPRVTHDKVRQLYLLIPNWYIYPTTQHGQVRTEGKSFTQSITALDSLFSFL